MIPQDLSGRLTNNQIKPIFHIIHDEKDSDKKLIPKKANKEMVWTRKEHFLFIEGKKRFGFNLYKKALRNMEDNGV